MHLSRRRRVLKVGKFSEQVWGDSGKRHKLPGWLGFHIGARHPQMLALIGLLSAHLTTPATGEPREATPGVAEGGRLTVQPTPAHRSTDLVVVLPGIMGSTLSDTEGQLVWACRSGR